MDQAPLIKDKITEELRNQINELRSNSPVRIPSERYLAESLGVSRVSLRSAIRGLIDEGLLVQIQGSGTYITPAIRLDSLHILCSNDIKSTDPFYNKFLVEVAGLSARRSIALTMKKPEQISSAKESAPLVIIGLLDEPTLQMLTTVYSTIVAVQDYSNSDKIMQVYFDDYKVGYNAAKTLLEYQHDNICLLAGPDKYPSALERKKGFLDALKGTGAQITVISEKMNWEGGYRAGGHIISSSPPGKMPAAVFASNDWMALGLVQKLKESSLKVPEDISVIGCDDIPLASEYNPGLATFNLDMKELIEEVFSILSKKDASPGNTKKKILLPAAFICRESLKRYNP